MLGQHFTRDLLVKRDFAMRANINANTRVYNYKGICARVYFRKLKLFLMKSFASTVLVSVIFHV